MPTSRLYTTNRGVFHEFFGLFGNIFHSDLVRQIKYLKVENQTLRRKLSKRIRLTSSERRRLIKFGLPLGSDLKKSYRLLLIQPSQHG